MAIVIYHNKHYHTAARLQNNRLVVIHCVTPLAVWCSGWRWICVLCSYGFFFDYSAYFLLVSCVIVSGRYLYFFVVYDLCYDYAGGWEWVSAVVGPAGGKLFLLVLANSLYGSKGSNAA